MSVQICRKYCTTMNSVIAITLIFFGSTGLLYNGNVLAQQQIESSPETIPLTIATATESHEKEYDFIIVGSGSAGSVIANRLSEIGAWKILLLETGYTENSIAQFPLLAPILQFTDYNWDYAMEPQKNICRAMEQQRCPWPRGKALGGSSVINYMLYTRGTPEDYDRWAALGNPGWSYQDVLPYFLKSENSRLRSSNEAYHNKGGYLNVENGFQADLTATFLKASQELGYKIVDYNSPDFFGFSKIQATIKVGRRHSVARAFLKPIIQRKNLLILTGARVTKILIDPSTKAAYGVHFTRKGKRFMAKAKKEVIICAGVLNSAQLLMLSGIGPKDHLKELGIAPLVNLPVGQTLYDHISFYGLVFDTNTTVGPINDLFNPIQLLNWYETGVGPLSSIAGTDGLAYIKTNISKEEGNYPDIEILVVSGALNADFGLIVRRTIKMTDDYFYKMYGSIAGDPGFSMLPVLLHPKSKGYMKLRSSNPLDAPLFYGNYLTDPEDHDLKTLIAGIRSILEISKTEAFKKYNTHLNTKPIVGCEGISYNSDDYWRCALQYLATTAHHQSSTCKMGPVTDPTSVVDHTLKVHGVKNLRVADTSIIPVILSAHIHAPAVMVGEKASDLIKMEWDAL